MTDLPASVGYITVVAKGLAAAADSNDGGTQPDAIPLVARVDFTADNVRPVVAIEETPQTIIPTTRITCNLDADGNLRPPTDGLDTGTDESGSLRLVAPDGPGIDYTGWRWTAKFTPAWSQRWTTFSVAFGGVGGETVDLGEVLAMELPPGVPAVGVIAALDARLDAQEAESATLDARLDAQEAESATLDARLDAQEAELATLPATYAPLVDVTKYGAIGDGASHPLSERYATLAQAQEDYPAATALTDEIDWAAITKAVSLADVAFLPSSDTGEYVLNRTITLASGKALVGDNGRARLRMTANDIPILDVTGTVRLLNLITDYSRQQTSAETNGIALRLYNVNSGSVIEKCSFKRGSRCIYNAAGGYTYSTTFRDLDINGFSISGIDIANAGGITGNVLSNVYVHNNYGGSPASSTAAPVLLGGWDEGLIQQLNVEWCIADRAITLNQVYNLIMESLHFEGFTMTGEFGGIIELVSSFNDRVTILGMTVVSCVFTTANISSGTSAAFKMSNATYLRVLGFHARSNTVTIANLGLIFASVGAGGQCFSEFGYGAVRGEFTADTVGDLQRLPGVRQYNRNVYWWQEADKVVFPGTAAPTTGTWARGDKVPNTSPSAGGTEGWVCTTAGTPGTWKTYGSISA